MKQGKLKTTCDLHVQVQPVTWSRPRRPGTFFLPSSILTWPTVARRSEREKVHKGRQSVKCISDKRPKELRNTTLRPRVFPFISICSFRSLCCICILIDFEVRETLRIHAHYLNLTAPPFYNDPSYVFFVIKNVVAHPVRFIDVWLIIFSVCQGSRSNSVTGPFRGLRAHYFSCPSG